jgi:HAD superfamily hydrolase (TIGR01509 family)
MVPFRTANVHGAGHTPPPERRPSIDSPLCVCYHVRVSDFGSIRAVIFDMDGLILDSERVALSTFVAACREFGFDPDVDVYYRCIGGNAERTRQVLTDGYGKEFPYDDVVKLWHALYEDLAVSRPFPVKEGVRDLLAYLERRGTRRAVVTSTKRASAMQKLSNASLSRYFELVIGGDEITKSKPDPEIYLTACLRLGERTANCVALEDSDNGVLSAFRAGLTVIQVPDLLQPSGEIRALGHEVVNSLVEVRKMLMGPGHTGE